MNGKMAKSLADPVRCKLLLDVYGKERVTAKQLAQTNGDVTHATLYRHLKKMVADGLLQVVGENKIRGTLERVYAVNPDLSLDAKRMVEENDGQAYMLLFTQFALGLTEEFRKYTSRRDIDIIRDGSGFTVAPIYVTTEELTAALLEIGKILQPLIGNEKTAERDLHSIAIITTPPHQAEEK